MTRLRLGLARALALIGAILLWTLALAKETVTLIGATTVGDDFQQLLERLPVWANWFFTTPWWVPSLLATALTVFLIWLSWPREFPAIVAADSNPIVANNKQRTAPHPAAAPVAPELPIFVEFEFPGHGFGHGSVFRSAMHHRPGTKAWQQYEELWVKITALRPLKDTSIRVVVHDESGGRYREWDVPELFTGNVSPEQTAEVAISRRTHQGDGAWLFPTGPNIPAKIGGRCRIEIIVFHEDGPSRADFGLSLSNNWERRPRSEVSRLNGIENRPITSTSKGGFFLGGGSIFDAPDFKT